MPKRLKNQLLPRVAAAPARTGSVQTAKKQLVQHSPSCHVQSARAPVLVAGGAGYIGSLLAERLLLEGYGVRVLDNLLYGEESLQTFTNHPGFELIVGDCRNTQDVVRAMHGIKAVIHLAAIVGDGACDHDYRLAVTTNYVGTRTVAEVAKACGVTRFLFASSCSVYGRSDRELDEEAAVLPISLYARTKAASERHLLRSQGANFHPSILRFATAFGIGYRRRFDLVVNALTAKSQKHETITIYNAHRWRPFLHVRDLVEAVVRVMKAPVRLMSGEIFNVGDARLNHTFAELASTIQGVFPELRIEYVDNSDRRDYRIKCDKLLTRTGFQASYSLRDGVEEIKRALDKGEVADYADVRYHNERCLKAGNAVARR